ncbi:uncharacterized protein LOC118816144 isoform X2 [Colossoma macropomum]|uniref:uncharacterized protein LOC118816144 isoform X2 n=1 Tax=Colossoma macropomum TaxID=42526 RepID=UPI0018649ECC|nr:uncharacterized protein LOC118816144 isoform X2 [Colossoma macropomum]
MSQLAEREMLIHSTKMETAVFIQDAHLPQESSTTSKANLESRDLQSRTMRLMLGLISGLVLLVVGMVGLCIWMYLYPIAEINEATPTAAASATQCERVNLTMSEGKVFKVPHDGTYFIYGQVKRQHEKAEKDCNDEIRLCWNKTKTSGNKECKKGNVPSNSPVVEIMAVDVQLEKNSEISFELNCKPFDTTASFRVLRV